MSWTVTPQLRSVDGIPIGTPYGGGYVAGFISHTANGVPTHALIVAPNSLSTLQWKTSTTTTAGANSLFDGRVNTDAIIAAGLAAHPAAQTCVNTTAGGFTDWYLPAVRELEIAYRNLKPGINPNDSASGANAYAVPGATGNYTASSPSQTWLTLFREGQPAAFPFASASDRHWTSTETAATTAAAINFDTGSQFNLGKNNSPRLVRAFRRIAL